MSDLNILALLIFVVGVTASGTLMGCRLNIKENVLWKKIVIFTGLTFYGIGGIIYAFTALAHSDIYYTLGIIGPVIFFIGCIFNAIMSIRNLKERKTSTN